LFIWSIPEVHQRDTLPILSGNEYGITMSEDYHPVKSREGKRIEENLDKEVSNQEDRVPSETSDMGGS